MNSTQKNKTNPYSLNQIETFRLSKMGRLKINIIHFFSIIAGAIAAIILLQETESRVLPPVILLFLVVNFVYTVFIYNKVHKAYESFFNENLLDNVVPKKLPGVDFLPDVKTADIAKLWKKCQPFRPSTIGNIYTFGANKKSIGFKGVYKDLDFELYNVRIKPNHQHIKKGSNSRLIVTETEFEGFLMRVKRAKKIETPVYITFKNNSLNNPIANMVGGLINKNQDSLTPPPRVILGLTAFEEKLAIYTDNKEVAKNLLTNTIVEEISKSFNAIKFLRYTISFIDDQVYLIMDYQFGIFTAEVGKSIYDRETVDAIFNPILEKINFLKTLSTIH